MGLFSRVFGEVSPGIVELPGPGTFSLDVVGTVNYQDAKAICDDRADDGPERPVIATLIHEEETIRVDLQGKTVGHLDVEVARQYKRNLRQAGYGGSTAVCSAVIVREGAGHDGQWMRFSVKLDLPTEG